MSIEEKECFLAKTTDNQLYDLLVVWSHKFPGTEIPTRECFNDLTLDNQLWLMYSIVSSEDTEH
jgi:hypothetical protein